MAGPTAPGNQVLSPREQQMLSLAAQGLTDKGIAAHLSVSTASVDTYWGRIRLKSGPYSRTELVANWLSESANQAASELRADNQRLFDELSEHAKTEEMLKARLELADALLETHPEALLLVNERGAVELANARAREIFGYDGLEMTGLSVEDLVPSSIRNQHYTNRTDYAHGPAHCQVDGHIGAIAVRKDGTEFPVAVMLSSSQCPNGLLVTCIIRDLTPKTEADS